MLEEPARLVRKRRPKGPSPHLQLAYASSSILVPKMNIVNLSRYNIKDPGSLKYFRKLAFKEVFVITREMKYFKKNYCTVRYCL